MSKIQQVRLWKDPGFTDGCIEVPAYRNNPLENLGTEDMRLVDHLYPGKNRFFSLLKVDGNYEDFKDFSYMALKVVYNNDVSDKWYFGWIDSVTLSSDSEDYPKVDIEWHVDLWRTYFEDAEFGYGMVENRPDFTGRPPQQMPCVYKDMDWDSREDVVIMPTLTYPESESSSNTVEGKRWWVYISYAEETNSGQYVENVVLAFPVLLDDETDSYNTGPQFLQVNNETVSLSRAPTMKDALDGRYDELLGLDTGSINAVVISPLAPFGFNGTGFNTSSPVKPVSFDKGAVTLYNYSASESHYTAFRLRGVFKYATTWRDLGTEHLSTETEAYVLTDLNGGVAGYVPYGRQFRYYGCRMVQAGTSFYMVVRLTESTADLETVDSVFKGMELKVPLPMLPLTSNSWSTYLYSGQREYDMEQRKTQNNMALASGLSAGLTGGTQGAMMGSLNESLGRGVPAGQVATSRSIATMGGLGALGAVGGVAGAVANYGIGSYFSDELQEMSDNLAADQTDSFIISGDSLDFLRYGDLISIVPVVPDAYSKNKFENQIALNGVSVSEPTEDCSELCRGTGPLRISNLIVKGDIPVEAKQYIKARFANGVRLIGST